MADKGQTFAYILVMLAILLALAEFILYIATNDFLSATHDRAFRYLWMTVGGVMFPAGVVLGSVAGDVPTATLRILAGVGAVGVFGVFEGIGLYLESKHNTQLRIRVGDWIMFGAGALVLLLWIIYLVWFGGERRQERSASGSLLPPGYEMAKLDDEDWTDALRRDR